METHHLNRPVWLRFFAYLPFLLMAGGVCLFLVYLSYSFIFTLEANEGMEWLQRIIGLLFLPFAVFFFFQCVILIINDFSQVTFSALGIKETRFGKQVAFISWDDLAETGIGLMWGNKAVNEVLYFSDRPLSEVERAIFNDCPEIKSDSHPIYVYCRGIQHLDILKEICPLPIPAEASRKVNKYGQYFTSEHFYITSFRRTRRPNGLWDEPELDYFPNPAWVARKHSLNKRKRKR